MIKIVTGEINDRKTTKMLDMFKQDVKGDGFISIKTMKKDRVHSYHAMQLSTGRKKLLSMHADFFKNDFDVGCRVGPYYLNAQTIEWVERKMMELIEQGVEPLYFDEIGMLELGGAGFDRMLRKMVKSGLDLVLVIRFDLIKKVIKVYDLKDVEILKANV
ncbi:MAG: hypothetical protein EA375_04135 [Acholeplasmataceae bacterium]|nr:MAG: hypothetical protein EA375_04135 [Acholeplasmataceae bacterium]